LERQESESPGPAVANPARPARLQRTDPANFGVIFGARTRLRNRRKMHWKIFSQMLAYFSPPAQGQLMDHVYHAIHHKLTTKTPPLDTTTSKITVKNTSKRAVSHRHRRAHIFSRN
jgi:hypothetical protein